jgi:peroxiredoxin
VASAGSNDDQADEVQQLAKETQEFLNDRDATFPTYVDRKAALRMQYIRKSMEGGFGFPTTLVLDKTGTIRGVWAGYRPGDEQQIATLIEELLAL